MSTCASERCELEHVTGYYRESGSATDRRRWASTPWLWCPTGHGTDGTDVPWAEECAPMGHSWRQVKRRLEASEVPTRPYRSLARWQVCENCGSVRYV